MDTAAPPATDRKTAIESALSAHCGSLERTHHWTGRLIYTPGVAEMAELCQAYWLIDLIASHQIDPKVAREEFQHWTLTVAEDRTAIATLDDGDGNVVATQAIEYTDFPLDEIKFYFTDGTLLLPGEY